MAVGYCKVALRLTVFAVYCPPTVRRDSAVRVAGAGVVTPLRGSSSYSSWLHLPIMPQVRVSGTAVLAAGGIITEFWGRRQR
jgi:hypothetical protein